jgi:hypothetical protein
LNFLNYFQVRIKVSFYALSFKVPNPFVVESRPIGPHGIKLVEWNVLRTSSKKLEIIVFIPAVSTCVARGKWQRVEDS